MTRAGRATACAALLALVVGCQRGHDTLSSRRDVTEMVAGARRAAIADLDGDGRNEIVLVDDQAVRVIDPDGRERARGPISGGIQVLETMDLDGDGRAEIVAGWGLTRWHRVTQAKVTISHLDGNRLVDQVVMRPTSKRPEIAALTQAGPGRLLVAWFDDRYDVTAAMVRRSSGGTGAQSAESAAAGLAPGWSLEPVGRFRMATSWAWGDVDGDGTGDLVVGRVYGDAKGVEGDAFVLRPGGKRVPIATTRGVRGLAVADTDGDGRAEVFLGDGWHEDYGRRAQALLTEAHWRGSHMVSGRIDQLPHQFTVWQIFPADVDGDRRPELVVRGTGSVKVYRRDASRVWRSFKIGGVVRDIAVGDLDGRPGAEVLVVGKKSAIVTFAGRH